MQAADAVGADHEEIHGAGEQVAGRDSPRRVDAQAQSWRQEDASRQLNAIAGRADYGRAQRLSVGVAAAGEGVASHRVHSDVGEHRRAGDRIRPTPPYSPGTCRCPWSRRNRRGAGWLQGWLGCAKR